MYIPELPPHKNVDAQKPGWLQLLPFFIFVGGFLILHIIYLGASPATKAGFALSAILIALFVSLLTFTEKHSLNEKINIFINGTRGPTIIYMCYIFIFSAVFTHIATKIGSIHAVIKLGIYFIPSGYILPGLFSLTSLFAFTMGSSIGSIVAFMPIALGFSETLNIDPSLISGVIVGASMFGDNLSMISDTTIAASKSAGCSIREKVADNLKVVAPAFLVTLLILYSINRSLVTPIILSSSPLSSATFLKVIPYLIVFVLAISSLDALAVLTTGALSSFIIGLYCQSFTPLEATSFIFQGLYSQPGVVGVLMLVMFVAGLAKIVEYNGGFDFILETIEYLVTSKRTAEAMIALLSTVITAGIVSNTVGILISGKVAKKIGDTFHLEPVRIANLLDMFACVTYGLLPYAPPLLLAGALASVSSISIIPYIHYQFIVTLFSIISIMRTKN